MSFGKALLAIVKPYFVPPERVKFEARPGGFLPDDLARIDALFDASRCIVEIDFTNRLGVKIERDKPIIAARYALNVRSPHTENVHSTGDGVTVTATRDTPAYIIIQHLEKMFRDNPDPWNSHKGIKGLSREELYAALTYVQHLPRVDKHGEPVRSWLEQTPSLKPGDIDPRRTADKLDVLKAGARHRLGQEFS